MSDLFSKFDPLIETREQLLSTGITDPFGLVMDEVVSPTVAICNGRKTILLGTYNYMGMTFDPDVIAAAVGEQDHARELDAALALLRRRFPDPPAAPRDCERALGMLVRKGYDLDLAYDVVRAFEREPEAA